MFRLMLRAGIILWLAMMAISWGVYQFAPTIPPDGRIVYVVSLLSKLQLYTSDLAHDLTIPLQPSDSNDFQPTVSTMSGDIVFASDRYGDAELFMLSANGHSLRQLTDNELDDLNPQWSPDGSQMLYQSNPAGISQFFLMDADGTNRRQLTDTPQAIARPSWSPDGSQIAYDSGGEIIIYDIASGNSQRLTNDNFWDQQPSWSPDGKTIIYESNRGREWLLYKIDLATNESLPVSSRERTYQQATWTDEPNQIIFQSARQFTRQLYTLRLDNPSQIDAIVIPPKSGSSLYLLFGIRDVIEPQWTDVIEPVWMN
jgi:Tol biopolymer transport system component